MVELKNFITEQNIYDGELNFVEMVTNDTCINFGCLWEPVKGVPSCFLPPPDQYGYEVVSFLQFII